MNESLEKAEHDLGFASDDLREALHKASAVEAIVLLPLIKLVNEARNEVAALSAARGAVRRAAKEEHTMNANVEDLYLYDSETRDMLTPEDLGITPEEYTAACRRSMEDAAPEGHIYVAGWRVYAAE